MTIPITLSLLKVKSYIIIEATHLDFIAPSQISRKLKRQIKLNSLKSTLNM